MKTTNGPPQSAEQMQLDLSDEDRGEVGRELRERHSGGYFREVVSVALQATQTLGLPALGERYLRQAIAAPRDDDAPSPRSDGRFVSLRMGVTLELTKRFLGYASLEELESDDTALLFCDRPPLLTVKHLHLGRGRGYQVSPSLLVVRPDHICLITLEEEAKLQSDCRKHGAEARSIKSDEGAWSSPDMEAAARQYGFRHEIWTEFHFNALEIKNRRLLQPYQANEALSSSKRARETELCNAVSNLPGSTFSEMLDAVDSDGKSFSVDDVFRAIARKRLFLDLCRADLSRYSEIRLFSNQSFLHAHLEAASEIEASPDWKSGSEAPIQEGDRVVFDGLVCDVVRVGDTGVMLRGVARDKSYDLSHADISLLRKRGKLATQFSKSDDRLTVATREILGAGKERVDRALSRLKLIKPILEGLRKSENRTVRRYVAAFKTAATTKGLGFLGLLDNLHLSGRHGPRYAIEVTDKIREMVKERWEVGSQPSSALTLWNDIDKELKSQGLTCPSYSWICEYLRIHKQELKIKREGKKSAYQTQARGVPSEAQKNINVEPTREFQRVHVDHTLVDLQMRCSRTGRNLGRLWITVLIDHVTRRILGMFLSFEPPSCRSLAMALRDCVRRNGRLPKSLLVDGGKEFHSTWFEQFCAVYNVDIIRRPPCEPRFGSQIERFFGSLNTMLLNWLKGNTRAAKKVRQMTPLINPISNAVWTLPSLHPFLVEFLFDVYEELDHRGIATKPRHASQLDKSMYGIQIGTEVSYSESFLFMTCATTRKGTAKVGHNGIKVNYFWFNNRSLYSEIGNSLQVRFDPFDLSIVYAFFENRWQRLESNFKRTLHGISQREFELITTEYRKRRSDVEKSALEDNSLAVFVRRVLLEQDFLERRLQKQELNEILIEEYKETVFAREGLPRAANDVTAPGDAIPTGSKHSESAAASNVHDEDTLAEAVAAKVRPPSLRRNFG